MLLVPFALHSLQVFFETEVLVPVEGEVREVEVRFFEFVWVYFVMIHDK